MGKKKGPPKGFTVRGEVDGIEFVISWEPGEFQGKDIDVAIIEQHIAREPYIGLPTGPFWEGDAVKANSLPAYLAIVQAMGVRVELIAGEIDYSVVPELPPGAIA